MSNYNNYNNGGGGNGGQNRRVEFQIIERLGTLVNFDNGWSREINIVIWNGGQPKYDIRDWDPEHRRMTKGVRLLEDEAEMLYLILGRKFGPRDRRVSYSNRAEVNSGDFSSTERSERSEDEEPDRAEENADSSVCADGCESPVSGSDEDAVGYDAPF